MPLLEWDENLSVGAEMIDNDHKHLIDLVNQLHDAVRAARGKEVLGRVLDGLVDYTRTHFGREAFEMTNLKYPKAAEHLKEHAELAKQVLELQAQYRAGSTAVLSLEAMAFLRDWLINHSQASDAAFGVFLAEQKKKRVA